jgi:diguanylate cyclase
LQTVQREAITDGLTGLPNRKHFDNNLRGHASTAMEEGTSLSLLLLDVDHFKHFNDTFGHRIGDEVLKVVGRLLLKNLDETALPARYGGEEFAVILPRQNIEAALVTAEAVRASLASHRLTNKATGEKYGRVTVSIGAAEYRLGEPLSTLVERADDALYRAKQDGRNRVVGDAAAELDARPDRNDSMTL